MMETKNTPAAFINMLLKKHGIALETAIACMDERQTELEQIKDIYALRNSSDAELLLTLPQLLISQEQTALKVIEYFKAEEPENAVLQTAEPNLEQHKLLLISALMYNTSFFSMAWNWCAFIQDKVRKGQAKPGIHLVKSESKTASTSNGGIEFVYSKPVRKIRMAAASPGNHQFAEPTPLEGIGELYQYVEEVKEFCYFQFVLSITNEQLPRPFVLEVNFTSVKDGKSHQLKIEDNPDDPKQTVRSVRVDDIDISQGIEIHRIDFKPVQNNG